MANLTPTAMREVVAALGAHLKTNMASLEQVLLEFPAANVALKLPSLTITLGQPVFTPLDPYVLSKGAMVDYQAAVKYVVGMYDFQLQVDLWARDKVERLNLFEEFFQAFNQDVIPPGLRLQLTGYHSVWCNYSYSGYSPQDDEASSQTGSWRGKITILANTRAVQTKTEYIISTIENQLSTVDTVIE